MRLLEILSNLVFFEHVRRIKMHWRICRACELLDGTPHFSPYSWFQRDVYNTHAFCLHRRCAFGVEFACIVTPYKTFYIMLDVEEEDKRINHFLLFF